MRAVKTSEVPCQLTYRASAIGRLIFAPASLDVGPFESINQSTATIRGMYMQIAELDNVVVSPPRSFIKTFRTSASMHRNVSDSKPRLLSRRIRCCRNGGEGGVPAEDEQIGCVIGFAVRPRHRETGNAGPFLW